jgi:hypothetical protein
MPRVISAFTGLLALCATVFLTVARSAAEDTRKIENELKPVLALTIRCDEAGLKVGDEIPITFVIKNEGNSPYKHMDRNYDRSGRMPEYKLSAVDEPGKAVADPRAKRLGGICGGLAGEGILSPDKSFTKTIALNRWALLTVPGVYRVTGTYYPEGGRGAILSPPITIMLQPRTDDEMAVHVKELSTQLADTNDGQARASLVRELMYTCDRRIVPALMKAMYKSDAASYWAGEAFHYYLPDDPEINHALLKVATERGLAIGMLWTVKQRGVTREQIKPLIEVSLSPDYPAAWREGALAAQQYAEDRFTPRLIVIATDPKSTARAQAIYALALNRTDESVATLKRLLREPDPLKPKGRTIRQTTEAAIRVAYLYHGNTEGKRLRKDDFDVKYQRPSDVR